ncbi:MAG TPA: TraB/GumN family protein [Lautropia sp.]|nr:TraB/GumN family protein [Lautropia sp.]
MFAAASTLAASVVPAAAQAPRAAEADEIVVTAQRTGIPVWRVNSPTTTLVLIGSIDRVAKGTRWDPAALNQTLLKADRVMFPGTIGLTGSPFSLIGYALKWRKHATLPKGQTLASLMRPDQFQRLVALRNRGVLKPGFERKHPLHLALMLHGIAKGKDGYGLAAGDYVSRTVRKNKIKTVPITSFRANPVVKEFFAEPPKTFVPCLLASIALVEAGPGTIKRRSDAWAERRVPEVLASPVEPVNATCHPSSWGLVQHPDFRAQVRTLLAQPQLTVAVVELGSLARPGGVLDSLAAAGFDVRGPRWKS